MSERRERPDELPGTTQRIATGWGSVYVTVNVDGDGPFEVFVTTGQSGGLYNAQAEALGKTISNALRSGADAATVADDLQGISSGKVEDDNGDTILSIPDAVGVAIQRHLEDRLGESVREEAPEGVKP